MSKLREYFSSTQEEATQRYENHKRIDPFPSIAPTLLSSAYIQAYIAKTGMIYPYFPSDNKKEETVTPASLTLTIGQEILFWDSKNERQYSNKLDPGHEIKLRPNSITFLRTAEHFSIPDYIAARFNLRIVHVHRGLLLGTGPLLDPGFKGFPMIPVHNLTENEYLVHVGEDFINVEFTKIHCENNGLGGSEYEEVFTYSKNRGKTFDFDFTKYIKKNVPHSRVKSSLSSVLDEARKNIALQKKISMWTAAASALAMAALIFAGYQLTVATTGVVADARYSIDEYKNQQVQLDKINQSVYQLSLGLKKLEEDKNIEKSKRIIAE